MSSTFKHLTYEEWIAQHPEMLIHEQKCPKCDGSGEMECSECGSLVTCDQCNGTGKVKSAREVYEFQKRIDDEMMNKYLKMVAE